MRVFVGSFIRWKTKQPKEKKRGEEGKRGEEVIEEIVRGNFTVSFHSFYGILLCDILAFIVFGCKKRKKRREKKKEKNCM